tara:strand:+ start:12590 stop:13153 length:564 start_codon:yes stop_codon:yes gene_type:complete
MDFLDICKIEYNESKQIFENEGNTIFFTHFGDLSAQKISEITSKSEEYLKQIGASKKNIKASFNILIEGLQNIINHGELSSESKQIAFFNIGETSNHFTMSFSNLINIKHISKLKAAIKRLNDCDQSEIKDIYIDTLTNGEISKKGGAGLGLITMAMKSKNKINFHVKSIDSKLSIITITIILTKTK